MASLKTLGSPLELEPNEKARFVGDYKFFYEDGRWNRRLKLSDELSSKNCEARLGNKSKYAFMVQTINGQMTQR